MAEVALVVLAAGVGERFGGLKQLLPVGPDGQAIMDYSIHGALVAGFDHLVVVVRAGIAGQVRRHLDKVWDRRLEVDLANQHVDPSTGKPAGTVSALVTARSAVRSESFAVVNADDLYPPAAFVALHRWLSGERAGHALVGFQLANTVLPSRVPPSRLPPGSGPVTRALCCRHPDGSLAGLVEAQIERRGGSFLAQPLGGEVSQEVEPAALVSMNAWGFRPSIWPHFEEALLMPAGRADVPGGEILLPTVISGLLPRLPVRVLATDERCLGVTWAADVEPVRATVLGLVRSGTYPRRLRPLSR